MEPVPTFATARERARAQITTEILEEAGRQLASEGAAALSLRAVARQLGMASSALYRYFPSRDELLTALIIEAYDGLGERAESADAGCRADDFGERWRTVCRAVRGWARDNPHQYALVYGSPVPGYIAPERTIGPASRITRVLVGILRDAGAAGLLVTTGRHPSGAAWEHEGTRLANEAMPGMPPDAVARALVAWTQLFGLVSFELFGHLVGVADPDLLFDEAVAQVGAFLGLPAPHGTDQREA
jgi:AcrR family transcriptional regulator